MVKTPNKIFIVPYRDRIQHKFFFIKHMSFILEQDDDYEILIVHQCDDRAFNRGAMKNIGFLAVKSKYPSSYQDITLVFNDIDTIPFHKLFNYNTQKGIVKHFYGFRYALGGILSIKAGDFENVNGFPNLWGWGLEDTCLQKRCEKNSLLIDRENFYELGSPEILQLFDGLKRIVTKEEVDNNKRNNGLHGIDGIITIHNLYYTINDKSLNKKDNIYVWNNSNVSYVNVQGFDTLNMYHKNNYIPYDLRTLPKDMFKNSRTSDNFNIKDDLKWTNITDNVTNNTNENHNNDLKLDETRLHYTENENNSIKMLQKKFQRVQQKNNSDFFFKRK